MRRPYDYCDGVENGRRRANLELMDVIPQFG